MQKCKNFEKCCCTNLDCGSIHTYRYCYNYQNTKCSVKKCPYLHCTIVEQYRYEMTGKATENLKKEIGRTLQNSDICGDFKKNICKRTKCYRRHIKSDDSMQDLECPICRDEIMSEFLGAALCGHIFCYKCALRCLNNNENETGLINLYCPLCNSNSMYKRLM